MSIIISEPLQCEENHIDANLLILYYVKVRMNNRGWKKIMHSIFHRACENRYYKCARYE